MNYYDMAVSASTLAISIVYHTTSLGHCEQLKGGCIGLESLSIIVWPYWVASHSLDFCLGNWSFHFSNLLSPSLSSIFRAYVRWPCFISLFRITSRVCLFLLEFLCLFLSIVLEGKMTNLFSSYYQCLHLFSWSSYLH